MMNSNHWNTLDFAPNDPSDPSNIARTKKLMISQRKSSQICFHVKAVLSTKSQKFTPKRKSQVVSKIPNMITRKTCVIWKHMMALLPLDNV